MHEVVARECIPFHHCDEGQKRREEKRREEKRREERRGEQMARQFLVWNIFFFTGFQLDSAIVIVTKKKKGRRKRGRKRENKERR